MANIKISELPLMNGGFADNDVIVVDEVRGGTATTKKNMVVNLWTYIKNKAASWFGITVTGNEGHVTGRSFAGAATQNYEFTYVVDSDQKLADWANNVAGNDYTSVLIKKGIWRYNAGSVRFPLNLTATGTKVIIGEVGSQLQITGSSSISGLHYETIPDITDIDYLISNVTVKVIGGRYNYAFHRCVNLYHCIGIDASSTYSSSYSFISCKNLVRCKGTENRGSGFRDCNSVKECVGNSYYNSYSSPTNNSNYACANTLEGGWNTTI